MLLLLLNLYLMLTLRAKLKVTIRKLIKKNSSIKNKYQSTSQMIGIYLLNVGRENMNFGEMLAYTKIKSPH